MKALVDLLPIGIGVAVAIAVTWFLLDRDWGLGKWLFALLLFAHGWVHMMFAFPKPQPAAADAAAWPFDMDRSWLISQVGLDGDFVRIAGLAVMLVVFIAAVLAALSTAGLLVPAEWWPGLVVAAASSSALLLAMFFAPALLLGFAIDAALLWLVIASAWSPAAAGPGA